MTQATMAAVTCQKESNVVGDIGKAFMVISYIILIILIMSYIFWHEGQQMWVSVLACLPIWIKITWRGN